MSTKSLSSESVRVPALDQLEEVDEGKLFRKLDLRILPLVSLLYLLSFLDRTNIGESSRKFGTACWTQYLLDTQETLMLLVFPRI